MNFTLLVNTANIADTLINAQVKTGAMSNLTTSFVILAKGMTGIFVFMAVFYLLIIAMERIFKERKSL